MEEGSAVIVVLSECGKITYVIAHGMQDLIVGKLSEAPQQVLERLSLLYHTEGTIIIHRALEDLTGLFCV